GATEGASGPVPFATGGGAGTSGGGFGTPDPSYGRLPYEGSSTAGSFEGRVPHTDPSSGAGGGAGFATPGADAFAAGRGQNPYGPYGSPTETAGGGVPQPRTAPDAARQVTLSAAGRRFSCSVVVAAAAVVAVLSGGGLYGLGLLPGTGGDRDQHASGDSAATPPKGSGAPSAAGTPVPSATPSGTRADVPAELTGTWKGTVTTARAGLASEFQITITTGKVGDVVGRDKSILPVLGTDCSGDWKLASATDRSLVLDTAGNTNPAPGICSNGSSDERFTLNTNGTLHYKSGDAPAGNPEGDLTRIP
ncbi:hypothetical protein ACFXA3_40500, partial [Streptomyces sp. NPDC059456]